jgi:predicted Zn finger-like uncharacterized protein
MFTTCPACRMNLAVTANDLRIGQGYVRCGRCERVFNALMSLSEDVDPAEQSGLAAHGTGSMPALEEPEDLGEQPADDKAPDKLDVDVTESSASGTVETIVLEGDGYLQTEEHVGEEELRERLQAITGVHEPGLHDSEAEEELDADAILGNPPRQHWGWKAALVLLLLLLAGQMVHHYRHVLVANRWLEKPLQTLYGMFGQTLEPAWDLSAYDLRQLGGEALALNSTTIVLRATVQNRASHPQPPPLIRVRLQDRFGNSLSTTAVAPDDYLKGPAPARMAPDQRLDVELRLEDPNRQAVSFDLDACLPGADGALHCAHDL